jgi:CPA2 family monovalent cation:H+ antiporter-2
MEGSLMMASHTLLLLGMPISSVLKRIRAVRESRYELMRGFFRGATDEPEMLDENAQPRLSSVHLGLGHAAIGKVLAEINLEPYRVSVVAIRRRGIKMGDPQAQTRLEEGDVIVLKGTADALAAAATHLAQG